MSTPPSKNPISTSLHKFEYSLLGVKLFTKWVWIVYELKGNKKDDPSVTVNVLSKGKTWRRRTAVDKIVKNHRRLVMERYPTKEK